MWEADVDMVQVRRLPLGMQKSLMTFVGLLFLAGCSDSCATTPVKTLKAPDGLHTAVIFQRDCGATTDFSTHISILKDGYGLSRSGNAFVADADHGAAITGDWGGPWVDIEWVASDHLVVRYAENSRIFEQDNQVSGIRISYDQANR